MTELHKDKCSDNDLERNTVKTSHARGHHTEAISDARFGIHEMGARYNRSTKRIVELNGLARDKGEM